MYHPQARWRKGRRLGLALWREWIGDCQLSGDLSRDIRGNARLKTGIDVPEKPNRVRCSEDLIPCYRS